MSAFDKVVGYENIKRELLQVCDMLHNKSVYEEMGARMPRGVLLFGEPGLGKTLMAKCFIEESGLPAYTVRRNRGTDDFVSEITASFSKAKETAPSIVFLDDMDKFANEDENHRDAEEYAAVQAGIDDAKDSEVFVFATVNNMRKLPRSLLRTGRFDRKIEVYSPADEDAFNIIKHYLKNKKVSEKVNLEDVAKMISYSSCAELETIMNEAAINAAYARRHCMEMEDLVDAVLRMEYDAPNSYTKSTEEERRKVALHEAGHLVVCEVLHPGSVGIASMRATDEDAMGGFIKRCKDLKRRPYHALVSLGGKAAVELYYAETCASGCQSDLTKAIDHIRTSIAVSGACGLGFLDMETSHSPAMSNDFIARNEAVTQAILERYLFKAREILVKNRGFLESAVEALMEKETLLYSDIRTLRESVEIVPVAV